MFAINSSISRRATLWYSPPASCQYCVLQHPHSRSRSRSHAHIHTLSLSVCLSFCLSLCGSGVLDSEWWPCVCLGGILSAFPFRSFSASRKVCFAPLRMDGVRRNWRLSRCYRARLYWTGGMAMVGYRVWLGWKRGLFWLFIVLRPGECFPVYYFTKLFDRVAASSPSCRMKLVSKAGFCA